MTVSSALVISAAVSAAMMNSKIFMGFACFLLRFQCETDDGQWQIDVQPNESQGTRMTNSNMLVQPYLFFGGRCEEALEFYRSAVGAEVEMLSRFKDAPQPGMAQPGMEDKVMHASFRIGETTLMASDGRCEGEPRFEGFSLSIDVPDEKKAESVFNALTDGGKVTMPLEKTFWAPKFGMLEDRFGVGWMVSVQHKP